MMNNNPAIAVDMGLLPVPARKRQRRRIAEVIELSGFATSMQELDDLHTDRVKPLESKVDEAIEEHRKRAKK